MSHYPTDEQLVRIRQYADFKDMHGWFDLIQEAGNYWPDDEYWTRKGNTYHISTGGWSGNEDIISAMSDNFVMWTQTWQEHRRGGHYVFVVPSRSSRTATSGCCSRTRSKQRWRSPATT